MEKAKKKNTQHNSNNHKGETVKKISEHISHLIKGDDGNVDFSEILNKYDYLRITEKTNLPPADVIIRINGENISSQGDITTVSGSVKSGKSAFVNIVIAGSIAVDEYDGLPGVEILKASGKAVLHFDTEQSKYKHQQNFKSILKRARLKSSPENFMSYNLRKENLKRYKTITEEIVQAANDKFGGIHLIAIDGLADYMTDVNDAEQSNDLLKWASDLAADYNALLIPVMHVNPGSDKERGHLGSQSQRKSESVLIVKSDGDVSTIEAKFLRSGSIKNFSTITIRYDKDKGYHVACDAIVKSTLKKSIQEININELASAIFTSGSKNYGESIEAIKVRINRGEVCAKTYFTKMRTAKIIIKDSNRKWGLPPNLFSS